MVCWARFGKLGNVSDIGQCNIYSAMYGLLGYVWDTGQNMGYRPMPGILGNIGDFWGCMAN